MHTSSDLSVMFDDDHAVANAGLVLASLLSEKLGWEELWGQTISIAPVRPRRSARFYAALPLVTCANSTRSLRRC